MNLTDVGCILLACLLGALVLVPLCFTLLLGLLDLIGRLT